MNDAITVESVREVTAIEPRYAEALALVSERMKTDVWRAIDENEAVMEQLPQQAMPLVHTFTPNLYGRRITMPTGSLLTSRIHLVDHQFVILRGVVAIWDDERDWVVLKAGHAGVTKAGTRRVLYILEECEFMTFHATSETDPDKVVMQVTYTGGKYAQLGGAKA